MENKKMEKDAGFAFGRQNYIFLIIGFLIILLGFILMAGGKSDDPNIFNPDVLSFRRITLAPIIVLSGFIFIIYGILKNPKK